MEKLIRFNLNGKETEITIDPTLTLLWVLRDQFGEGVAVYLSTRNPEVKNHTEFHYVGQSMLHADGLLKVTGEAVYTADVPMRERVFAKATAPFAPGGT